MCRPFQPTRRAFRGTEWAADPQSFQYTEKSHRTAKRDSAQVQVRPMLCPEDGIASDSEE